MKARAPISARPTNALLAVLLAAGMAATVTSCSGRERPPRSDGGRATGPRLEFDKHGNPKRVDEPRPKPQANQPPAKPAAGQPKSLGEATARWQPPERTDDVAGYKVYFGSDPNNLKGVDVGLATEHTFKGLAPRKYYFSVASYNARGVESERSPLVTKAVAPKEPRPAPAPDPTIAPK